VGGEGRVLATRLPATTRNEPSKRDAPRYGCWRYYAPIADGWHWQPYLPSESVEIGTVVQQLITDLPYREVPLGDFDQPEWSVDDVIRKLQMAARSDQIILLIVDAWAGDLKRYKELLTSFSGNVPVNRTAVVVPWNERDEETVQQQMVLQAKLRSWFRDHYFGDQPGPFFKPRVTSLEEFRTILPKVLELIRNGIESLRAAERQIIAPVRPVPQISSSRKDVNA